MKDLGLASPFILVGQVSHPEGVFAGFCALFFMLFSLLPFFLHSSKVFMPRLAGLRSPFVLISSAMVNRSSG